MKNKYTVFKELRTFLILWGTQSFSALGSAMTNFALIIWTYQQRGSALTTALLSICSYAPYVVMSILAGALSDKWNKKLTMMISDSFAAMCTVAVLILLKTGSLQIWHLYVLNALNGLMNTVQQPASSVAVSLLAPKRYYQSVSGLQSLSNSLVTVLTPALASAILAFGGLDMVILFDLCTCAVAVLSLVFFIRIPETGNTGDVSQKESLLLSVKSGLSYLKHNRGILDLILFLAAINLTASIYNAALPAMLLSRENGSQTVLGIVNTATGLAALVGSILASISPAPKSRVRVICNCLLFAMSTENFILAFGRSAAPWCIGAVLGWLFIPVMNTNLEALMRTYIPIEMQGRVYSARNTLQFFTIPLGYFLGGLLVDRIFEPFMALQSPDSLPVLMFGSGKGTGAAALYFILAFAGITTCLIFRNDKHIWHLENRGEGRL